MPFPLALLLAIVLVFFLYGPGFWIMVPVLMITGMVYFGWRHLKEESRSNGKWILDKGKLFGYLLSSFLLLLITFMLSGADLHNDYVVAVLLISMLFMGGYAGIMAACKKE